MNEKHIDQVLQIEKQAQEIHEAAKREAEQWPGQAEKEAQAAIEKARAEAEEEARRLSASAQSEEGAGRILGEAEEKARQLETLAMGNIDDRKPEARPAAQLDRARAGRDAHHHATLFRGGALRGRRPDPPALARDRGARPRAASGRAERRLRCGGAAPGRAAEPIPFEARQILALGLNPLVQAASPLLLLAGQIRGTRSPTDTTELRRHALNELRVFEERARGSGI